MILNPDQLRDIILNNPAKEIISAHRAYQTKMLMHLYGTNLTSHLEMVESFESKTLHSLRTKYTRSNKALFAGLGRPIDKVFSAKGGSIYYNTATAARDKIAAGLAANIRDGYKVKDWIAKYWLPHAKDDPGGVVFMEIGTNNLQADRNRKPYCYPTYRAITDIYDYKASGSSLEYIVFNVSETERKALKLEEGKYFRVVDDAFDMIIQLKGEQISQVTGQTLFNYFGLVPGVLNSDIVDPTNDQKRLGLFDEVIEVASEYLLKGSIKVTHDFLHGFPKYWQYAEICATCNGTTMVNAATCPTCKGSGKQGITKVSDVLLLDYPDKDQQIVTPDVGGYISPDKDYYEIATNDMNALKNVMEYTMWGHAEQPQVQVAGEADATKTATEVVSDQQPMIDRLTQISESAEKRHKFILDLLIRLQLQPDYQGASVNYGRRYHIEGPDVLLEKYQLAKKNGLSISLLSDLWQQYIESEYANDPVGLEISSKLKAIEPSFHYTLEQVKANGFPEEDLKAKMFFSDWLETKSDSDLFVGKVADLRNDLMKYASAKKLPEPEKETVPV